MCATKTAVRHRWADLPTDQPMPKIARQRIIGQQAMLSQVTLETGCVVPSHAHENEQIACVISGRIRFGIGTHGSSEYAEMVLASGEVLLLPSNVPHSAEALEKTVILDVFSPPSETTGIDRGDA